MLVPGEGLGPYTPVKATDSESKHPRLAAARRVWTRRDFSGEEGSREAAVAVRTRVSRASWHSGGTTPPSCCFGNGQLEAVADRSSRLEQIAEAHAHFEQGCKTGNVVLTP